MNTEGNRFHVSAVLISLVLGNPLCVFWRKRTAGSPLYMYVCQSENTLPFGEFCTAPEKNLSALSIPEFPSYPFLILEDYEKSAYSGYPFSG